MHPKKTHKPFTGQAVKTTRKSRRNSKSKTTPRLHITHPFIALSYWQKISGKNLEKKPKIPLASYTKKLYNKSMDNKRKHGIGFETARFVFADPGRLWRFDRSESNTSGEERWQTLGRAEGVVFAVYTENETEGANETRMITARLATKAERRIYNGYYHIDNQGWSKAD